MQYNRLNNPNALIDLIKDLDRRVSGVETRGTGSIGFVGADGVELHIGLLPDGQAAITPFVGDTTPPPIATSPDASTGPGFITVTWDGLFVNGESLPLDFEHLNVVGHKIVGGSTVLSVEVGIIRNPMDACLVSTEVAAVGETWEFSFVSEDYNGNLSSVSARSDQVTQKSFAADALITDALDGLAQDFVNAQSAAASAQQAADAAQDAADANALAITQKGKIYTQSVTPSADPNGLWIDTGHNNVPRRYIGTGKALFVNVGGGASVGGRLTALGWNVTTVTAVPTLTDAVSYDLVAFDAGYAGLGNNSRDLAVQLLDRGVSVFTSGNDTTNMAPLFTGATSRGATKNTIRPVGTHPAATGWASYNDADLNFYLTGVRPEAVVTGVTLVTTLGTDQPINVVWEHPTTFARWTHVQTYASPVSVLNAHLNWISDNWVAIQDQSVVASIAAAQLKADQAFNNAATAAEAAGNAQSTADNKNRSWYQPDQPAGTSHKIGDNWFDTDDGYKLRTWTGTVWQTTQDSALAQSTADAKGRTYTQNVAPPVEARNDKNLWIDTSAGVGLYVTKYWDGSAWTALKDKDAKAAQDTADAKGETIYSTTEPAAAKRLAQNTWVDTSGGLNIQKRWDGSAWVVVVDSRIPSTAAAVTAVDSKVTTVSATADSKGITYTQSTVPPVSARLPQNVWIDTSLGLDKAVTKYWNGSAWTAVSEKAASDAQAVADSKGETIYSTTAPATAKQLPQNTWVDTSGGLNIAKRWDGSAWVVTVDSRIPSTAAAVTAVDNRVTSVSASVSAQFNVVNQSLQDAQTSIGTTGITLTQSTVPSAEFQKSSNIWIDISLGADKAVTKYWNGSAWTATSEKAAADAQTTADAKGETIYSSSAPAASKQLVQNTWVDTTGGLNIAKRWDTTSGTWVVAVDSRIPSTAAAVTAVDTKVTSVSAAASGQISSVDSRVTGVSAAASSGISTVDSRVTGVSAAASGQITSVDTRVTGVSAAASSGISTVDARVTGVSAAAALAADKAESDAISAQAYSNNASFDEWPSGNTYPTGYASWSSAPVKETSIVKRAPFAMRFNVPDATAQYGTSWTSILAHAPNLEFFTVEVDLYLVSGTLGGSGMILDWTGMTNNRAQINFASEIPGAVTGKWYRVSKVLRRPTNATGTWTSMTGYLMGQWSGHGTGAAKNIIYDWFNIRPSTTEEILSYKAPTTEDLTAVDTRVTGVSAAATTQIGNVDTRVTGVSAAASGQITTVDTRVTGVSAAANTQIGTVDSRVTGVSASASGQITSVDTRVTGVSAAASGQITTVDTRVTGVSAAASGQITSVDTRVTGVSAAASGQITTVDTRVTGVSAAASAEATAKANAALAEALASSKTYLNDANNATNLQFMQGSLSVVASDSAMGGYALQKSGSVNAWFHDNNAKQAYDPTALYRLSARVRVSASATSGGKGFYFGFVGLAADGTTYVNITGANSFSNQQWTIQNAQVTTDGNWVDYVTYYRGLSASTPTGAATLADPKKMHANTRMVVPGFILDYPNGNGTWELSHWSVDVVDATGYQALLDAASAQGTANSKTKTYFQTASPSTTGNTVGDIWFDTDDGNKPYVWNGSIWANAQDLDIQKSLFGTHATDWDTNQPNKWAFTKYTKTTPASTSPTYGDIAGLTGVTTLVSDATSIVSGQGDNYIGQLRTIVNNVSAKTIAITATHDDGARVYVNGISVYSSGVYTANAAISFSVPAGWSVIDILWAEQAGGDGITAVSPLISSQVTNMYAPVSLTDAASTAYSALTSANGKNKVIWSTSDASGTTGYTAGDTWFKRDGSGAVIAQWEFTTSWQPRTVSDSVLGNINAGKIVAGTLSASVIGGNTISASKLIVSDMEELIPNPFFHPNSEPVATGTIVSAASTPVSAGAPYPYVYQFSSRDNHPFATPNIPVRAGDQFFIEVWVAAAPTAIRNFNLYMFRSQNPYGGLTAVDSRGNVAPTQTWTPVRWDYTVPADGYNFIKPVLQVNNVGGDTSAQMTWYATGWTMRRKNTGKLIVDGAIQANSAIIANGAIGNAQIADLNADKINAGTIAAARLNADDIRTKLLSAAKINAVDIIATGSISSSAGLFGVLDASSINAGTLSAARLNADDIRTKLLAAAKINAVDIIASGSISSSSGVFGDINASAITSGTLSAARIGAGSISASALSVTMGGNNLVANSSFEADSNSDGLADGWNTWARGSGDAGRVFTNTLVAGLFPGSTFAQRVTTTTVTNTEQSSLQASQLFYVNPGDKVTLSLYCRANSAQNFSVSLRCEDNAGAYKGDANFVAPFDTTVQRFFSVVTIPAGTTRAKVTITSPMAPAAGSWFEVDGIKAEIGDIVSAWSPMASELLPGTINATMLTATAIDGKTITGPTIQTTNTANRGIKLTTSELAGYDNSGNKNFSLTTSGTLTLNGSVQTSSTITGSTVTGSTIQSEVTASRGIKFTSTELAGYDAAGVKNFSLLTDGTLSLKGAITSGSTITGATVTGATIQTESTASRGIKLTTTELAGYNASGVKNFSLLSDGTLSLKGSISSGSTITGTDITGGTVTGSTVQSEATASRGIKMTSTELAGYDGTGTKNFSLTSAGALYLRGEIKSGSTIEAVTLSAGGGGIQTTTAASRGVKLTNTGITTYDASGNMTFKVDATTGLVEAPGLKANSISSTMLSATAIDGMVITGPTIQTVNTAQRGIKLTSTEFAGYDNTGVKNFSLLSDGTLSLKGAITSGSTVTGATVQSEATASRGIKMTSTELAGYDTSGTKNFSLTSAGALYLRGEIKSGSTIEAVTLSAGGGGIQTTSTALRGVKLADSGIKAYDSAGNLTFNVDASTGVIEAPGLKANSITADKLSVGSSFNLFDDAPFKSKRVADWELNNQGTILTPVFTEDTLSFSRGGGTSPVRLISNGFKPVTAGEKLQVSLTAISVPTSGTFQFYTYLLADNGTSTNTAFFTIVAGSNSVEWTVPAGTVGIKPYVYVAGDVPTADVIKISRPQVLRKVAGSLIVDGALDAKIITGSTIQTELTGSRGIKLTSTELAGYDGTGQKNLSLTSAGALYLRGEIKSGSTIEGAKITGTQGLETSTNATTGVKINNVGIKAYDGGNNLTFHLDATTGMLEVPGIKVNSLNGDRIVSQTIAANKLAVADFTNLATIDELNGVTISSYGLTKIVNGWNAQNDDANIFFMFTEKRGPVPFKLNDTLYFEFDAKATVDTTADFSVWTYNAADTNAASSKPISISSVSTPVTGELKLTSVIADAKKFVLGMQSVANKGIQVKNVKVYKKNGGELIVDGAIKTNHMKSGTIDAGVLTAGSVTSAQIKAKSITVDDLVVSSTDNLVVEADFSNGGASWDWNQSPNQFIYATGGRGGLASYRVLNTTTFRQIVNLSNKISVEEGNRYRGCIWVKANEDLPANSVKMFLRSYTSPSVSADVQVLANTTTITANTWTPVQGILPAIGAGVTNVEVVVWTQNPTINTITDVDFVSVSRAMDANLVVDGAITAVKIAANAIEAKHISSQSIMASAMNANAIDGMVITGATIRTNSSAVSGIKLDINGLRAYDGSNSTPTFDLTASNGKVKMVGRIRTGLDNEVGATLLPASESQDGTTSGLFITPTNLLTGQTSAGMWVAVPNGAAPQQLQLRGLNGGSIKLWGPAVVDSVGDGATFAFRPSSVGISFVDAANLTFNSAPTTSSAANAIIATSPAGRIYRSTSSRRYKADIQDWNPDYRALGLTPRSWVDRCPIDPSAPLTRYYGYIAEEVEEVMPEFVSYNEFGEPESVTYDRMPSAATIAMLKDIDRRLRAAGL